MNVHAGEGLEDVRRHLREHVPEIRSALCPDAPFGLGMRLSNEAVSELHQDPSALRSLKHQLQDNQLYVFSLNAFPYGTFHSRQVKDRVYAPDWRTADRLTYTLRCLDVLEELLPPDGEGSISTVPLSFKSWETTSVDHIYFRRNLMAVVAHASMIENKTGKLIHLGLEPEPSFTLETTAETLNYFKDDLFTQGRELYAAQYDVALDEAERLIRRHVGVCLDTCHVALQFEDPAKALAAYEHNGIRVSKVQLSAALRIKPSEEMDQHLRPFVDEVYLHQVKAQRRCRQIDGWDDLPDFLHSNPEPYREVRIHYHVPLDWGGSASLQSTRDSLSEEFWEKILSGQCQHIEVETYTFDVLPDSLRLGTVEENMVRECQWVLDHCR